MTAKKQRADVFIEQDKDPRTEPPQHGDERETLLGFLRWQRETLELKCADLDAEQLARRAVEPSTMSLLGLVRHMADVERGWFRRFMAGQDAPPIFYSREDPDGDFDDAVADPTVVEEAWRAWHEEVAFADKYVAESPDLGVIGKRAKADRGELSLRWVLTHMIEEYARHLGHADLLRERIDGRLGQ
ncbi:MAG TPA: DinB family protein [Jiangellaceae bacterium]